MPVEFGGRNLNKGALMELQSGGPLTASDAPSYCSQL